MKKHTLSALLSAALLALPLLLSAGAAEHSALGEVYYRESDTLSPGLTYSELYSRTESENHRSFVFEYRPFQGTLPLIRSGEHLYGRDTLSSLVRSAENEGYDVVSGINGDFFSFQTGIPMSALIANGRILSSNADRNAFGIRYDGSVIAGNPAISLSMAIGGRTYKIDHYNKYPTVYGVYAMSDDYAESTKSSFSSREIVIALSGKAGTVSGFHGTVSDIRTASQNSAIPEGSLVITIPDQLKNAGDYKSIKVGDSVAFTFTVDPQWMMVETAIGGGDLLVENGKIKEGIVDEAHEKQNNPRTAVGAKADGTILFFATDGKQSGYSTGLTLNELAATMQELGCVTALNLDGGGSTTVAIKHSGANKVLTVSRPSDGSERSLANAILFANTLSYTGVPASLKITPNTAYVLKGSALTMSAAVRDTSYKVIESVSPSTILFTTASTVGRLQGNTFLADTVGEALITASAVVAGVPLNGSSDIFVVDRLDRLEIEESEISIPSKSSYALTLSASLDGIVTHVDAASLDWSFSEGELNISDPNILAACDIAYIDRSGAIHPNPGKAFESVTLTVSYGGITDSVKITVGRAPALINAMEYGFEDVFYTDDVTFTQQPKLLQGTYSLLFSGRDLLYLQPKVMAEGGEAFTLWVDSFPLMNECFVRALDADGIGVSLRYEVEKEYPAMGLVKMKAVIPSEIKQPLTVLAPFSATLPVSLTMDAFTLDFGDEPAVFADMDEHWAKSAVSSLYETGITQGSVEADGGRYYHPNRNLTRAEFAKMLVSFRGIDTASFADTKLSFADTSDIPSWALPYVKAAVGKGLMNGKAMPDGKVHFCPNDNITRTEVMYVFGSLMTGIAPAPLTFADANKVPEWAREKLSIAYAAGVITGYEDNTLKPLNNITRAEIASVFSKMLQRGR